MFLFLFCRIFLLFVCFFFFCLIWKKAKKRIEENKWVKSCLFCWFCFPPYKANINEWRLRKVWVIRWVFQRLKCVAFSANISFNDKWMIKLVKTVVLLKLMLLVTFFFCLQLFFSFFLFFVLLVFLAILLLFFFSILIWKYFFFLT